MTALLAGAAMIGATSAATTLSNKLRIHFDGSLSGNAYTLGAGEIDTTGTFAAGASDVSVSGGVATLTGGTQGFKLNPTAIGTLTTQNWVAEAVVSFVSFDTGQRTIIDVQGDTDFRIANDGNTLQLSYWDGSEPSNSTLPALPATDTFVHMAMVWDAARTSLTGYINGVSIGTVDGDAFATPDVNNLSFGYLGRAGFEGRGINGQLDAVAFSTFTGAFDVSTDFQVSTAQAVPEPSAAALFGLGGLALMMRRRK